MCVNEGAEVEERKRKKKEELAGRQDFCVVFVWGHPFAHERHYWRGIQTQTNRQSLIHPSMPVGDPYLALTPRVFYFLFFFKWMGEKIKQHKTTSQRLHGCHRGRRETGHHGE